MAAAVSNVKVTPTVNHEDATVTVNGTEVMSGTASAAIALSYGANTIAVQVTAGDSSTKDYAITVNRADPTVRFRKRVWTATEGTAAPVAVVLDAAAPNALSVGLSYSPLGVDLAADLEAGYPAAVTIPAGATTSAFTVGVKADALNEQNLETVRIDLRSGTGYLVVSSLLSNALFAIADTDAPAAPIGLALRAGDGRLSASWHKPVGKVTGYEVRYKESSAPDSTATGADPSTGWVEQAHVGTGRTAAITGLSNGTSYDVQVRATDGHTGYGPWSGSKQGAPRAPQPPPPPPTVTLTTSAAEAAEDAGAVTVTATLDEPAGTGGVAVTLAAGAASTATANVDYFLPAQLTVGAGKTAASASVFIVDDDVDEDDETLVLTTVSGLTVTVATLTIVDDDTAGVTLNKTSLSVAAGATAGYTVVLDTKPTANVTVTPTSGATDTAAVSGALTFTPGTWSAAQEVTVTGVSAGTSTVSHAATSSDGTYASSLPIDSVAVTVTEDAPSNDAPSNDATLSGLAGSTSADGSDFSGALTLSPPFTATTTSYTANVAAAILQVKLTPTVNHEGTTVTVNGTPVSSRQASAAIELSYGANTVTVQVTAENEDARDYTVTVNRADPRVAFAGSGSTDTEGASAEIEVRLEAAASALTVALTYAGGSADVASDLETGYPTAVTIPAGAKTAAFTVGLKDDALNEDREDFRITLRSGGGYLLGAPAAHTVTILDNDAPAAPGGLTLTVGDGALTASWNRAEGPVTGYEVRHKESSAPDSTAAGADPSTGWVTRAHGGTGTTAAIAGLSNGTSYDVQVRATDGDTGYGAWSGTRSSTPRTGAPPPAPAVSLSASPNPVAEGSTVTVTATLASALGSDVTIPLTVTPGTAEAGDHGTLASIVIDAGSTTGAGTVTTAQDADADDETFTVALGTLPASVRAGSPSSVDVTITDDDVTVGTPTNLRMTAGNAKLDLSWNAPAGTVTGYDVHYTSAAASTVADDAAAGGNDPSVAWVDADHGGTAASHAITGLTNGTAYRVRVRAVNDAAPGAWAHGTDTPRAPPPRPPATPTVMLSASPNPVDEGDAVTVTATLASALGSDVTIPLTITPGTAEAGDHGTLASIVIDAGSTTGAGTVTTAQDADADDETFTVALGTLPASVTAGSPSSVDVTITDDDGEGPAGPPVLGADEKAHVDKVGTALLGLEAHRW